MFKHFRVILRITPRDIGNFFKSARRFIKSILPAFLISFSILTAFSMPVLASTASGGLVEVKPSPALPVDESVSTSVDRSYYYKHLVEWIQDRGYNAVRSSMDADLYYFFTVLVSDTYGVSTGSYKYPDGRIVSGSAYPIRAKSGSVYLNAFNPDYLHSYFDIFKLSMNDSSNEAISCCKSIFSGYIGCPNTNSAVALTSKFYPFAYSFDGFSDYYNALYSDYLVDNGDSGKSVGYEDLNPSDYIESPTIPGDVFNSIIDDGNTLFFPKNFNGKVSYRNDEMWHNKYDSTSTAYDTMEFYTAESGFSAVGGGDEIYLIFFEKLGDVTYYHKYQFHFTVNKEDIWYTDRDEINYTNYRFDIEYWDIVNGSADDDPIKGSYYDQNGIYRDSYYRIYFSSVSNVNYKGIKFPCYSSYSDYFNYNKHSNSNAFFDQFVGYNPDLLSSITMSNNHFTKSLSSHDESCAYNGDCDFGYIASLTPISTTYKIDTSKVPDNYYITINGDTIYDYSITNPETGVKDTINNYITNNYTLPDPPTSQTSTGTGTGGGNVNVDVDVTVNIGGNGNHYDMPDTSFFDSYLDNALEESTGIRKFIGDFFNTLPGQITQLIGLSIVIAILCRLIGR